MELCFLEKVFSVEACSLPATLLNICFQKHSLRRSFGEKAPVGSLQRAKIPNYSPQPFEHFGTNVLSHSALHEPRRHGTIQQQKFATTKHVIALIMHKVSTGECHCHERAKHDSKAGGDDHDGSGCDSSAEVPVVPVVAITKTWRKLLQQQQQQQQQRQQRHQQ